MCSRRRERGRKEALFLPPIFKEGFDELFGKKHNELVYLLALSIYISIFAERVKFEIIIYSVFFPGTSDAVFIRPDARAKNFSSEWARSGTCKNPGQKKSFFTFSPPPFLLIPFFPPSTHGRLRQKKVFFPSCPLSFFSARATIVPSKKKLLYSLSSRDILS